MPTKLTILPVCASLMVCLQDTELFELIASVSADSLSQLSPHSLSDLITAFGRTRDPQAHKVRARYQIRLQPVDTSLGRSAPKGALGHALSAADEGPCFVHL